MNSVSAPPVQNAKSPFRELEVVIEYMAIGEIRTSRHNARTHSNQQIAKIAQSIKAFGFVSPLVCDHELELIAGHGRLAAAKLLGYAQVPVVRLQHLDDTKKRALRIADNKLAELSRWDPEILALEFDHFLALDFKLELSFDLSTIGFSKESIRRGAERARARPSGSPDSQSRCSISRAGDVWLLREHRLTCGASGTAAADDLVRHWQTHSNSTARLEGDGRTFDEIAAERSRPARPLPAVRRRVQLPRSTVS